MKIQEVITAINQMQADGIVERYAIGGAVGATFYLEPVATLDVGVFVAFRSMPGTLLLSPQPIFDYLKARGGTMEGEYIIISGWPVQFLPPTGPLVEEALAQAVEADVERTPPASSPLSTSPPSLCRPDGPRIKPASSSLSSPAHSTPAAFRLSSLGMAS